MLNIPQDTVGKAQAKELYESIEFTLSDGQSDYDLDSQQTTFRANLKPCHYVEIYSTQNITIKFNATTNHSITVRANSREVFDRQIANNIYLTNSSGSDSTINLYLK